MSTDRQSVNELTSQASRELKSGDIDGAIDTLNRAIALWPRAAYPYRVRAQAFRLLGREQEAVADDNTVATLQQPRNVKPGYLLMQEQRARTQSNDSLFSFDGTLGRSEYFKHWLYSAGVIITGVLAGLFLGVLGGLGAFLGVLLVIGAVIAGWWIVLASAAKRLRDLNKNDGLGILMFIPFVSFILWIYLISAKRKV